MAKLRGYYYCIAETYPVENGDGFRILLRYDRLEDAEEVMKCLEAHNYDFTAFMMVMQPVWEKEEPVLTLVGDPPF